jgi:hypothetical protein
VRACAAIILFLAGCADDGSLKGVRPKIVLTPEPGTALEFPETVIATEAEPIVIGVANRGEGDLLIESVAVEGAPSITASNPQRLAPGQDREIVLRFAPASPGAVEASLLVRSNDLDLPAAQYPVRASARERCRLSMSPAHQAFLVGEVREVTVSAVSTRDCAVTRILLDRDLFQIEEEPALPWTIAAGQSATLSVRHVSQSLEPGVPTRELRLHESEGSEAIATLAGEPALQDCLSLFPQDQLIFPTTPLGQIERRTIDISNACSREARVLNAVIGTGPDFFAVEPVELPLIVPALQTVSLTIEYHPFSEEGDRGVLNIDTNDSNLARAPIELFGQASKPRIAVFPDQVDFGGVIVRNLQGDPLRSECGSPLRFVQLYSIGDAQLEIRRLELEGGGDALFSVTDVLVDGRPAPSLTSTISIPPNKEGRINLRFSPSRLMPPEHEASLLIHHNAEGSPTRVLLRGLARDDTITTDTFTQLDGPRLDVLFVVQNTFLADDEQQKLIDYVESFVTQAEAANADYQMAVTVTDSRSENAGMLERCFPHPTIIRSDYADQATRIEALECTLEVGVTGSLLFVSGMGAARHAIERAIDVTDQDPSSNPNAGFIRPDAKLMIVVLTTRDDDSVESNALLRDYFLSIKGAHRPDRMAVHAIAGPVLGPCENQRPFFVWPGYRYFWMTNETGGIYFNVCEEDWSPFFDQIGLDVFQPIDEWDLTGAVDPASLIVSVDGALAPEDPANGWTFAPASNSIEFHGSGVPLPGEEVEITYSGLCRP